MNLIDAAAALYWFCANHHAGQDSSLYSVLSRLQYQPSPFENGPPSYESEEIYVLLIDGALDPEQLLTDIHSEVLV